VIKRVAGRNERLARDTRHIKHFLKKYPPTALRPEAEYFYRILLPEVTSNDYFIPSWIFALHCLCNSLVDESKVLEALQVSGAIGTDALRLELLRSRIAQFANYCGLGEFLIAPATPSLMEMKRKKELRLYETSILEYLDGNKDFPNKKRHLEKPKGDW
jgi:hypothetical protein